MPKAAYVAQVGELVRVHHGAAELVVVPVHVRAKVAACLPPVVDAGVGVPARQTPRSHQQV